VPINRLLKPCWHPTKTMTGRAARFSRPPRLPWTSRPSRDAPVPVTLRTIQAFSPGWWPL